MARTKSKSGRKWRWPQEGSSKRGGRKASSIRALEDRRAPQIGRKRGGRKTAGRLGRKTAARKTTARKTTARKSSRRATGSSARATRTAARKTEPFFGPARAQVRAKPDLRPGETWAGGENDSDGGGGQTRRRRQLYRLSSFPKARRVLSGATAAGSLAWARKPKPHWKDREGDELRSAEDEARSHSAGDEE